jgi:hypothetical protein
VRAPGLALTVEQAVRKRGPLTVSDIEDSGAGDRPPVPLPKRKDGTAYSQSSLLWRTPSDMKVVLDGLLGDGVLALAGRRGFERLYDLRERVLPQAEPPQRYALWELVRLSAVHGAVAQAGAG